MFAQERPTEVVGRVKDFQQRKDMVRFVLAVSHVFGYLFCALVAVWQDGKQGDWWEVVPKILRSLVSLN